LTTGWLALSFRDVKRSIFCSLLLGAACIAGSAQTPEQQFNFARQLETDGDAAFALLEYKRFVHYNPGHSKTAEARMNTANIYLFQVADVPGARQALGEIVKHHKGTPAAKAAAELVDFIEINSDFGGKPLLTFLQARREENRKKYDAAAKKYHEVAKAHPKARLAPEALVEAAALELNQLNQPQKTIDTVAAMSPAHVKHPRYDEARFLKAQAVEKLKGPGNEAIAEFGEVAKGNQNSPWRQKALAEQARIKKSQNLPKRQFSKQYVKSFKLVNSATRRDVYVVSVEVSGGLSEREVKATLEDALFKHLGERANDKHKVQIAAYFSYPVTKAGSADWTPGKPVEYAVREMKAEDAVKGLLFDLLKSR
jgi:outer membrane protein assembly factor BamD (BamD/ComL family)